MSIPGLTMHYANACIDTHPHGTRDREHVFARTEEKKVCRFLGNKYQRALIMLHAKQASRMQ